MRQIDPDELSAKLRTWKAEPEVPTSFQREVWHRIAVRHAAREAAFWPGVAEWLTHQVARPTFALGLLMVSLTAGVAYAHDRAQDKNARSWKRLEARYVASIDPVAMKHGPE